MNRWGHIDPDARKGPWSEEVTLDSHEFCSRDDFRRINCSGQVLKALGMKRLNGGLLPRIYLAVAQNNVENDGKLLWSQQLIGQSSRNTKIS